MKRGFVVLTAALMLGLTASPSYARIHGGPLAHCAPKKAIILLSDARAEIYAVRAAAGGGIYGCAPGAGHAYRVGDVESCGKTECDRCSSPRETGCGIVSRTMLAGTTVAYVENRVESGRTAWIASRSLRTGRVLHRAEIIPAENEVEEIAVKGDGSLAWIQNDAIGFHHDANPSPPTGYSIYAIDKSGFRALTGEVMSKPHGLKLVSGTLTWTQDGKQVSDTLT
jgi:hypothetical protein